MSDEKRPEVESTAHDPGPDPDLDAPPTEEEVLAAAKLRDAIARGQDPVATALRAAWAPPAITTEEHARLVEDVTLDDPLVHALKAAWAPPAIAADEHARIVAELPTAAELALAAEVEDDELTRALAAAWRPTALPPDEHRRIVERALAGAVVQLRPGRASPRRVGVAIVATTTVFALAASVILWITAGPNEGPRGEVALAKARSTQPLFHEPFKSGEASARIDRIALARSSDFRANLFAQRGVR